MSGFSSSVQTGVDVDNKKAYETLCCINESLVPRLRKVKAHCSLK